jgi:hypothetical protein
MAIACTGPIIEERPVRTRFVAIALGFALAVAPGAAAAAPGDPDPAEPRHIPAPMLPREECPSIPSEADDDMLVLIKHVLDDEDVTEKVRLATYETAWVESHVNDLDCGDRDSVGLYQQRPSQGWENAADPELSTMDFLYGNPGGGTGAIEFDQDNPDWTAGQIAQNVQISEFPDRYDEAEEKALELIERAADLDEGCEDDPDGCEDPGDPGENGPPVVDAGPDATGTEGDPIELAGSVTDPDDDPVDTIWTITAGDDTDDGAECTLSTTDTPTTTLTCTDDGTFEATLTGADTEHTGISDTTTVTIENTPPSAQITSPEPGTLTDTAQPVPVQVTFTDPGTNDTHECLVDFGDGSEPVTAEISQNTGECTTEHTYTATGVGPRTITATIQDDDGAQTPTTTDIVVYVPGSGHALEATGAVQITPTPNASCPPDTHQSAPILSTPVAGLGTLSVDCTVDTTTGQTDVVSTVAEATLLSGLITIEGIESTCTASTDGVERSSQIGTINGITIGSEPGTLSLLAGLVAVHYNESTTDDEGHLVQNALRVVLAGQEVTIASCQLG